MYIIGDENLEKLNEIREKLRNMHTSKVLGG
jgi:hypothetical protein